MLDKGFRAGWQWDKEINQAEQANEKDNIKHPKHYTSHPSGIECIQVTEHMGFCVGNAVKYLWRHDQKGGVEDLRKAKWYIEREIERLEEDNKCYACLGGGGYYIKDQSSLGSKEWHNCVECSGTGRL